jgi:ribonuclease HI
MAARTVLKAPTSLPRLAQLKHITIYTDGACSGNPGPGGWAAILIHGAHRKEISGGEEHTTNNRMELKAAIEALRALREPCQVDLHTDSAYIQRAFTEGWLKRWQSNGWRTSGKKPVENRDLWEELLAIAAQHRVAWVKVKGHATDELNNRADELAVAAMAPFKNPSTG